MASETNTIEITELLNRFPDEQSVVTYLEHLRWGDTPTCPKCSATDHFTTQTQSGRYWCRDGRHYFTAWYNTPLEYVKIPKRKWVIAAYLLLTVREGIDSLRLSQELGISQQSAWYMLHRLLKSCGLDDVQAGDGEKDGHANKKVGAGRSGAGKQVVYDCLHTLNEEACDSDITNQLDALFGRMIGKTIIYK